MGLLRVKLVYIERHRRVDGDAFNAHQLNTSRNVTNFSLNTIDDVTQEHSTTIGQRQSASIGTIIGTDEHSEIVADNKNISFKAGSYSKIAFNRHSGDHQREVVNDDVQFRCGGKNDGSKSTFNVDGCSRSVDFQQQIGADIDTTAAN